MVPADTWTPLSSLHCRAYVCGNSLIIVMTGHVDNSRGLFRVFCAFRAFFGRGAALLTLRRRSPRTPPPKKSWHLFWYFEHFPQQLPTLLWPRGREGRQSASPPVRARQGRSPCLLRQNRAQHRCRLCDPLGAAYDDVFVLDRQWAVVAHAAQSRDKLSPEGLIMAAADGHVVP